MGRTGAAFTCTICVKGFYVESRGRLIENVLVHTPSNKFHATEFILKYSNIRGALLAR